MPMKRRPGMSIKAFRDYYESKHRLIGEKYLRGFATRYVRRYVNALPDRSGALYDPEYDVVLEIWYPDEATFKACADKLQNPEIAREINDDEQQVFDMRFMRSYVVEEHESDMG